MSSAQQDKVLGGQADPTVGSLPGLSDSQAEKAFRLLLDAYECAQQLSQDRWDFAVEIKCLEDIGIARSGFRSLVCSGLIEHAREMKPLGDELRAFRPTGKLRFRSKTCFVLTEDGVAYARSFLTNTNGNGSLEIATESTHDSCCPPPEWDSDRQELRWKGSVVKRFKVPAPNQEVILAVFEEECWPPRIDDPLPQSRDLDPKRRLHDTINALNRSQIDPLIRFLGDGKGSGILWQPANQTKKK